MQILKDINDINFTTRKLGDEVLEVSEPIVMASAAGWYVGQVCRSAEMDGMLEPYDRHTHYVSSAGEAHLLLAPDVCREHGGPFDDNDGKDICKTCEDWA